MVKKIHWRNNKKRSQDSQWWWFVSCLITSNLQTQNVFLQPYFEINSADFWMVLACCLKFELKWCLFSSSRTWRTTWRTRTVWSVSGRPCAPTRQNPAPAVWDGASRTPRGTAQTPWSYVSPLRFPCSIFFFFFLCVQLWECSPHLQEQSSAAPSLLLIYSWSCASKS